LGPERRLFVWRKACSDGGRPLLRRRRELGSDWTRKWSVGGLLPFRRFVGDFRLLRECFGQMGNLEIVHSKRLKNFRKRDKVYNYKSRSTFHALIKPNCLNLLNTWAQTLLSYFLFRIALFHSSES
jgi:hypothetical protein